MSRADIIQLVAGLLFVILIVAVAAILPTYQQPDGTIVRRFVWDPPMMEMPYGYDSLAPEDIQRLSQDPRQREILEALKNAPQTIALKPIWVGSKYTRRKNWLGFFALSCVLLYGVMVIHKWISRG